MCSGEFSLKHALAGAVICQKLISVEGNGHCCHRRSSKLGTNQWTAKWEIRCSNPGQVKNLDRDFCSMRIPTPPLLFYSIQFTYLYSAPLAVKTNLGPHVKWIAEPVQSLDLPSERKKGSSKRCRHFGRKEKTWKKSNDTWTEYLILTNSGLKICKLVNHFGYRQLDNW